MAISKVERRKRDNARYDDKRREGLNAARRARGETKYVSKAENPEDHAKRMERQRDRREYDRKHGKASRKGKDIAHAKKGAKGSYRAGNRSKNRAEGGRMSKPNTKKA